MGPIVEGRGRCWPPDEAKLALRAIEIHNLDTGQTMNVPLSLMD